MNQSLYHHGILGQKWGVRRFQNKDGTSTAQGKKRRRASDMSDDELTSSVRRKTLENTYNRLSKTPSKVERTKKVIDASSNAVNQLQKINNDSANSKRTKEKLDLSKMTDQQLRERINRVNLEKQYNDMFANDTTTISKGQQYTANVLSAAGTVLTLGSSSLAIALAIKELKK